MDQNKAQSTKTTTLPAAGAVGAGQPSPPKYVTQPQMYYPQQQYPVQQHQQPQQQTQPQLQAQQQQPSSSPPQQSQAQVQVQTPAPPYTVVLCNDIILPATASSSYGFVNDRPANREYIRLLGANAALYHSMTSSDQVAFLDNICNFLTIFRGRRLVEQSEPHPSVFGGGATTTSYKILMRQEPIPLMAADMEEDFFKRAALQFLPLWMLGNHDPTNYYGDDGTNITPKKTPFMYRNNSTVATASSSDPPLFYGDVGVWEQLPSMDAVKKILDEEGPKNLLLLPEGMEFKDDSIVLVTKKKKPKKRRRTTGEAASKKKKADSKARKSTGGIDDDTKKEPTLPAKEIYSGVPDEPLEGGWPEGWTKKTFERQGGRTKGRPDRYWFSPIIQYKLRSITDVKKFLSHLEQCGGDEVKAKEMMKKEAAAKKKMKPAPADTKNDQKNNTVGGGDEEAKAEESTNTPAPGTQNDGTNNTAGGDVEANAKEPTDIPAPDSMTI